VNFLGRAAMFACHSLRRIRREETHDIVPPAGSPPGSRRLLQPRECAMTSRLPRLLGAFPDAMVIVDAQGRIRQANARAVSLFGCGERQLNGTPIQDPSRVGRRVLMAGGHGGEIKPSTTSNW
jgi:PAS domain-containing protein